MTRELEKYLERLKSVQTEVSQTRLSKPSDKTAFGYGQASGELLGLLRAEQLLLEVIEETANER